MRRIHSRYTLRPTLIIASLALSGMSASFMSTILVPIQGRLPDLLGASREDTAWLITITLLVSAISTPICGKLGDMFGKRRVTLVLLFVLMAGSALAAVSDTVLPLIIGRGLQGMGLGVIPLGMAILRDTLHQDRLGSAIALVSATLGVGGALGLPISAIVTENFDWHVLFWVAGGLGALCFVLVCLFVPASTVRSPGRVDLVGALGLAIGVGSILLAASRGHEWGWGAPITLSLFGGGAVVLVLWGVYEVRQRDPLVDLRTASRGPMLMTNLASIALGFALFTSSVSFPQLLQLPAAAGGLSLGLLPSSLIMMPMGLAMLGMSPISGRLERRLGPKTLLAMGALIMALGYLASALLDLSVWEILLINIFVGIGTGLAYAAIPALVMRAATPRETAAANAFNTLMRTFGTAIAAALVATVLAQSTVIVDGKSMLDAGGFQVSFLLGLGAATAATVLALAIPRFREAPALGDTPASRRDLVS